MCDLVVSREDKANSQHLIIPVSRRVVDHCRRESRSFGFLQGRSCYVAMSRLLRFL